MAPKIKRWADSTEVRNWAQSLTEDEKKRLGIQGIEVSERGRFHSKVVAAFNRAHRQQGLRYVPIGRNQPRIPEAFEAADQGEDDTPEVYRQPRQQPVQPPAEKEEAPAPPTPLPAPRQPAGAAVPQPMVLAMPGAPEPVMELLRQGQNVIVVYVPLPMPMAV